MVKTDHPGYSGSGFVAGYQHVGATTTFSVKAALAGNYQAALRYGNGMGQTESLSIYVNGVKIQQTFLASLAGWNIWGTQAEVLSLKAGTNTIAYKYDVGDGGNVNLDDLAVTPD